MNRKISTDLKRLNQFVSGMDATYHELYYKLKISDSAMLILYSICNYGSSCTLKNICYDSGLSKQTINSALRKLENEKIIYLENYDHKRKIVHLTEKGEELSKVTALKVISIEDEIFSSWKKEDVDKYLELTKKFLEDLKERVDKI